MGKKYDMEFKVEAIKLANESKNDSLIEKNLDIGKGNISRWKKEIQIEKDGSFRKKNIENEKIKKLEKENKRLRIERDILKKVVHVFTEDPEKYSDS